MKPTSSLLLNLLFMLILVLPGFVAKAQENEQVYLHGRRYLDLNIQSLNRYAKRVERCQRQMLRRLKRKEARLASRLRRTDSAAYARLKSSPLSFDSILRLSRVRDTGIANQKATKAGQKAVDSLKAVYRFMQSKAGCLTGNQTVSGIAKLSGYDHELSALQQRLSYEEYISGLSEQYAASLQGIAGNGSASVGIQKELYYGKAKLNQWKRLADDPSAAEEKALEYIQGSKGFDLSMRQQMDGTAETAGVGQAGNIDDLEKLGFHTKRQLNTALQDRFGENLNMMQGKVGQQLSGWQEKTGNLQSELSETKKSLASLKSAEKPAFHINPIRGLPFKFRLEKQYAFNTSRAHTLSDGTQRPAILAFAGSLAYKYSPRLSTGIGIAGDLGLGQSWSALRLTFEGIGVRSFLTWEWQYRIGIYGGYERTWKRFAFEQNGEGRSLPFTSSPHNQQSYSESLLVGLSKKYKVNSKWNGAIQLLFDAWWQQKELRSPIIIRFVNTQ